MILWKGEWLVNLQFIKYCAVFNKVKQIVIARWKTAELVVMCQYK